MTERTYRQAIANKASRKRVIGEVEAMAVRLGLRTKIEFAVRGDRTDRIELALEHFGVSVTLDGTSRNDAFVLSWHSYGLMADPIGPKDRLEFPRVFRGGSVNPHHHLKATAIAYTVEGMLLILEMGFEQLKEHIVASGAERVTYHVVVAAAA